MANKKYKLLENDTIQMGNGATLYRIEALIDFDDVKTGDKGGYIEKEENLSQHHNAWVSGNAQVYGDARVSGNAWVSGSAQVYDNAWVYGKARVYGDARVGNNAQVCANARVYGDAWISGNARVGNNVRVYDKAHVYGNARVVDNASVCDKARVCGDASVYGRARVYGDASIYDNAEVYGCAHVNGNARVSGTGCISTHVGLMQISPIGSEGGTFTAYLNKDGDISVTRGCFEGTLNDFQAAVEKTHGDNRYGTEYNLVIGLAKARFRK